VAPLLAILAARGVDVAADSKKLTSAFKSRFTGAIPIAVGLQ